MAVVLLPFGRPLFFGIGAKTVPSKSLVFGSSSGSKPSKAVQASEVVGTDGRLVVVDGRFDVGDSRLGGVDGRLGGVNASDDSAGTSVNSGTLVSIETCSPTNTSFPWTQ